MNAFAAGHCLVIQEVLRRASNETQLGRWSKRLRLPQRTAPLAKLNTEERRCD